jgi:preprotein translocase subunit SecE
VQVSTLEELRRVVWARPTAMANNATVVLAGCVVSAAAVALWDSALARAVGALIG